MAEITYKDYSVRLPEETIAKLEAEQLEQSRQGVATSISTIVNDCIEGWLGL